jgi:hypothetical protein
MGTLPPFPRDFSLCARILGRRRCNHLRRIPAPKSALELRLRSALSSVSVRTILTEYTWPQCCNDVSLPHKILMPRFALPLTASYWQSEAVFPPPPAPANWTYAPRHFLPASNPAVQRARAERHNPSSIATLRLRLARLLLHQLPCCPFCCALRLSHSSTRRRCFSQHFEPVLSEGD